MDFNNDTIKIDSLNSSKGILKIFVCIDGKRAENDNKENPNFYTIILKDYEVKNEFHDLSFNIMNNIELNISLKIRNIIGGSFANRMNIFKKNKLNQSQNQSEIISTGISMKDRLKLFNSRNQFDKDKKEKNIEKQKTNINKEIYNKNDKKENINSTIGKVKTEKNFNNNKYEQNNEKIAIKENEPIKENKENNFNIDEKEEIKEEKNKLNMDIIKDNKIVQQMEKPKKEIDDDKNIEIIKEEQRKGGVANGKENNHEIEKANNLIRKIKEKIKETEIKNKKEENLKEEIQQEINDELSEENEKDNDIINENSKEKNNDEISINENDNENNEEEKQIDESEEQNENNEDSKDIKVQIILEEKSENKVEDNNKKEKENNDDDSEEILLQDNFFKDEWEYEDDNNSIDENNIYESEENNEEKQEDILHIILEDDEKVNNNYIDEQKKEEENYEKNKQEKENIREKSNSSKNNLLKMSHRIIEKKELNFIDDERDKKINEQIKEINEENISNKNEIDNCNDKEKASLKEGNKIKKSPPIKKNKSNKLYSNMQSDINLNNKKSQSNEEKKYIPKKLDPDKFKLIIGQRFIGQYKMKPDEIKKENQDIKIEKSPSLKKENNWMIMPKSNFIKKDSNNLSHKNSSKIERRQSSLSNKKPLKNKKRLDIDFEIINFSENRQKSKSLNASMDSYFPENTLYSINFEKYLSELKPLGKKEIPHETFCEGFFLASFPEKGGQIIENSSKFPASCGHEECSELPSMKPDIIFRYPLVDTKNLELNNLAATICFPTGIKICYSEKEKPKQIKDYVTQITNQKGERYYMRTLHFYKKMENIIFDKKYETHSLKHQFSKIVDNYTFLREEDYTEEITNNIQKNLDFCQELGSRDIVYIPCCLCLISKYPYLSEIKKCLEAIYNILSTEQSIINFEINDLIMYLIHSIPIPDKNTRIQFYIPFCNNPKIEIICPKVDDISIMNTNYIGLFKYLSVDNIILIFRLLLSEKKILFIHDDYTELTNITNSFISLIYPFEWIHTYIPIMSDQMLKYLETFLPFLNGVHISLMNLVEQIFIESELEENEEVFLIYIKKDEINLSSSFTNNKNKLDKYIQEVLPDLPYEKELKKELKSIEATKNQQKKEIHESKIRNAFINVFVKMFHDYEKYIVTLDNDVVFNKVLFMQNELNEEENTEQFYDEFIESQLFQQFTQNLPNNENSYFQRKINEFKEKENQITKSEKERMSSISINQSGITYLASPYLLFEDKEEINIETILNKYTINESVDKENNTKIIDKEINIENNKYINSKCNIYLTPENKESENKEKTKEEEDKNKSRETKKEEMNEKQLDLIKEEIKDIVIKIFKSEIESGENKSLKKKIFNNLETTAGREFFISLISNKNNKIISLQENSFLFLEEIIKGILNSVLKLQETDKLLEEIVILILSTKSFESNITIKINENFEKQIKTIFKIMQKFFNSYNKITQKNFWKKWYDIQLKRKMKENSDEIYIKKEIIFDICSHLIYFEISKFIVKNICESINKIAFEEGSEIYEQIKKDYIDLITKTTYISKDKEC